MARSYRQTHPETHVFGVYDAAIYAGCSHETIARAIRTGQLKARKYFGEGNRPKIYEGDLIEWILAQPLVDGEALQ